MKGSKKFEKKQQQQHRCWGERRESKGTKSQRERQQFKNKGGRDDKRRAEKRPLKLLEWNEDDIQLVEELRELLHERDIMYGGVESLRRSPVVKHASKSEDDSDNEKEEVEDDEKETDEGKEEEDQEDFVDDVERVETVMRIVRYSGDVVRMNALLSGYAKDKKLHAAIHAFTELLKAVDETSVHYEGSTASSSSSRSRNAVCILPTVYTLASFVNACANSDDAELAGCAYKALTRAYGVEPNFVALTALVKVLANTGRIQEAYITTVNAIKDGTIHPNLRTFNALLRGCQHFGRGDIALQTLQLMNNPSPVSSSSGSGTNSEFRPDASSYECAVKALCHTGDMAHAAAVIAQMESAGGKDVNGTIDFHRAVLTNTASAAAYGSYATECALLGKRDDALKFLERARKVATLRSDPNLQEQLDRQARGEARGLKRSVMLAGGNTLAVAESRSASVAKFSKHQIRELEAELDLIETFIHESTAKSVIGGRMFRESTHVLVAKPAGMHRVDMKSFTRILVSARMPGQTKLNVELCSGYGDWIVERAASDDDKTLWCATEILHDRAHSVWSRSVCAGVESRVVTVCADAVDLVCHGLPDDSVDALFVNFPEPAPTGTKHFLEQPHFVSNARRSLKMGSCLTLFTDNHALARAVAKAFAAIAFAGTTSLSSERPEGYGTSYFDRLWANGKRVSRYCVRAFKY